MILFDLGAVVLMSLDWLKLKDERGLGFKVLEGFKVVEKGGD